MYSIVLAMALAPGSAAPAADLETELRDLTHVYYFSRGNSHFVDVSPCAPTLGFPKTAVV